MASNSSRPGNAVQIAKLKENKLYIDIVAFNKIIDKVGPFPMSIVSVNGPMRSGKSYILGYFLRYLSASENDDWSTYKLDEKFHWKNSAEPQTTGILMWSKPFFINRNGEEIAILLMDTQGCFDENTSGQENSAIFALSCLLSSVLIYNVKNLLAEDTYQNLHMFIGYTTIPKDSEHLESEDSESFSKLVFLIRDWECAMDFEYGYHDDITSSGPKNYKKEKLDATPGMAPENVIVRKAILNSFENVGCCLMPHPGKDLARFGKEENLDPDFIKTIKDFIPRIFNASNICLKKINGKEINSKEFKIIVENFAKCFMEYDFPEVINVVEATAKFQNHKALSIAMETYRDGMSKKVLNNNGLSEEKIEEAHKKNKEEAIAVFNRIKRIKHDDIKSQYMKKLENEIQEAFETYQKTNRGVRIAQESGKKSEVEIVQFKEEMAKIIKKLERIQEARTNIMTKQTGYFTVKIINKTDNNIKLYWKNYHFHKTEEFLIESKVAKSFSFYSYDNLLWSTKYRATIQYGNKVVDFCAFGEGAPREQNTFKVKSDGIFLNHQKHGIWKDLRLCSFIIVNETDSNIKLYWTNHLSGNSEKFVIQSKVSKSFSFYSYDNLLRSTKYRPRIQYGNKRVNFCAFGEDAPKEENIFKVKSDGIFLNNKKYSSWI